MANRRPIRYYKNMSTWRSPQEYAEFFKADIRDSREGDDFAGPAEYRVVRANGRPNSRAVWVTDNIARNLGYQAQRIPEWQRVIEIRAAR